MNDNTGRDYPYDAGLRPLHYKNSAYAQQLVECEALRDAYYNRATHAESECCLLRDRAARIESRNREYIAMIRDALSAVKHCVESKVQFPEMEWLPYWMERAGEILDEHWDRSKR